MRKPLKTISGNKLKVGDYLLDVWKYRYLVFTLALRDLRVQYAQTYLGILWSLIQPLTGLLIFYFFFQKVIPLNLHVPYAVFAFTGIMGWFYFTSLVGNGGTVLMHNQQLIKKIHFPRLVLPLAKSLVGFVEFVISLFLLLILMIITGCPVSAKIIGLPLVVLFNALTGLALAVWLSALTIRFRDLHHIIPYLVGFGIWLTPVFYPNTMLPDKLNWIYYLHPVANVIALYRWMFIGMPVDMLQVWVSLGLTLALLAGGLIFFIRNEKFVADYL